VKIKLICLAIVLMVPAAMFGGSDIMEKQLLQYKYAIFIQQISPFEEKQERKIYYIESRAEIQKIVNWLKKYYPDRDALDTHMLAIRPHCCIMFMNKLPTSYTDKKVDDENLCWRIYLNFDIDGKKYFTKEQLALLYKIFEEKGVPLKFNDELKN